MNQQEIRKLLMRYANGQCSPAETELLEEMVLNHPEHSDWEWSSVEEKLMTGLRIKQQIDRQRSLGRSESGFRWKRWTVAASLIFITGISWLVYRSVPDNVSSSKNERKAANGPALNGITLTLSSGASLSLDEQKAGATIHDGRMSIRRSKDGELVYERSGMDDPGQGDGPLAPVINSIQVGKGRTFRLTLPDGTRVWMNTASSLSYPVAFQGNERRVVLKGEAYFEVARDARKPFFVQAEDNEIAVTGTRFNISAYREDGRVTTTLLEGGVDVSKGKTKLKLRPGFQLITLNGGNQIIQSKADVNSTMAWQKGYFIFNDQDIRAVMKQVARWYDIEVQVSPSVSGKRFGGTFPKTASVEDLLNDLSALGNIRFKKQGKEVLVVN